MESNKQPVFLSLLSLILVCLYPCVFQYAGNAPESQLEDALIFFGVYLGVGLVLYLICLAGLRQWGAAGLLADLGMLAFVNAGLLTTGLRCLLPWMRARYLMALIAILLVLLFVLLRKKKYRCGVPCLLFALVFGVLSVTSLAVNAPEILTEIRQNHLRIQSGAGQHGPDGQVVETPNVYYYIYDEYGGPVSLDYYYDYDSSDFYDELTQRGFHCSMDSYNTESCATVQLVPNLYDLSYDIPPYFVQEDGVSPRLYGIFSDMGYQVNLINHNDFLDTDGAVTLTDHQQAESICTYLYENSLLPSTPLRPLLEKLPQLQTLSEVEVMVQEVLELMDTAWKYTGDTPTLTLGYIQLPHTQFLYDRDGNLQPEEQWWNWADPQYYLGQLEYTNRRILQAVDNIIAHDPDAIIILQSDHGARKGYHMEELYGGPYDPEAETIYQQNILNCVYFGGKDLDISGLSGINTLRTILNEAYGMDYEMLPSPTGFVNYYP